MTLPVTNSCGWVHVAFHVHVDRALSCLLGTVHNVPVACLSVGSLLCFDFFHWGGGEGRGGGATTGVPTSPGPVFCWFFFLANRFRVSSVRLPGHCSLSCGHVLVSQPTPVRCSEGFAPSAGSDLLTLFFLATRIRFGVNPVRVCCFRLAFCTGLTYSYP